MGSHKHWLNIGTSGIQQEKALSRQKSNYPTLPPMISQRERNESSIHTHYINILWSTVLKAADRSNNIPLDSWYSSTTRRANLTRALSVPYPGQNPDWYCSRKSEATRYCVIILTTTPFHSFCQKQQIRYFLVNSYSECQPHGMAFWAEVKHMCLLKHLEPCPPERRHWLSQPEKGPVISLWPSPVRENKGPQHHLHHELFPIYPEPQWVILVKTQSGST